jgi:hypothetical protein
MDDAQLLATVTAGELLEFRASVNVPVHVSDASTPDVVY